MSVAVQRVRNLANRFDLATLSRVISGNGTSGLGLRLAKILVLLVFLVNARSWPFIWHIKVFRPVIYHDIRYRFFLFKRLFLRSRAARKKQEVDYLDSIMPVGQNPNNVLSIYTDTCGIDDGDFNGHMSNSSYAKALDNARFKAAMHLFPTFLRLGGWIPLAATHFSYIREIPMFSSYEVRSTIAGWDQKWFYVLSRFVRHPTAKERKKIEKNHARTAIPNGAGNGHIDVNPTQLLAHGGSEEPSSTSTPFSGATSPANGKTITDQALAAGVSESLIHPSSPYEPDGALLYTVAVSQCCFKIGRITVPPQIVFAANGMTGQPGHSAANPHPEWEMIRGLSGLGIGKAGKEMRKIMQGGWKNVTDQEGKWWENVFVPEVDAQRKRNLERIETLRRGLETARSI